jgi:hypothetical protein
VCTLIVLDRVAASAPLVIASNRDEYLSRPAAGPALVQPSDPGRCWFVAPQDLEAGGSWMGVNAFGLFVGLTNRPTEGRRPDRRSRGLLVIDALQYRSAEQAAEALAEVAHDEYPPFNLYVADGRASFVTSQREDGISTEPLEPGVHVLCNRDLDDRAVPKVERLWASVSAFDLASPLAPLLEGLGEVLRSHEPGALEAACVHAGAFGTRSSALLALGARRWRYWHADGAPCSAKYRNFSALLDDLRQGVTSRGEP